MSWNSGPCVTPRGLTPEDRTRRDIREELDRVELELETLQVVDGDGMPPGAARWPGHEVE